MKIDFQQIKEIKISNLFEWNLKYLWFNFGGDIKWLVEGYVQSTFINYIYKSQRIQSNNFMQNNPFRYNPLSNGAWRHSKYMQTMPNENLINQITSKYNNFDLHQTSYFINMNHNNRVSQNEGSFSNFLEDQNIVEFLFEYLQIKEDLNMKDIDNFLLWFFLPFFLSFEKLNKTYSQITPSHNDMKDIVKMSLK